MVQPISTILEKASKFRSKAQKIEYLKQNASKPLKNVLKAMYDDTLVTYLPEGTPPYTAVNDQQAEGVLYRQSKQIPMFYMGQGFDNMDDSNRETIFVRLLETVDPEDAKLLIRMKDKEQYKGLSTAIVKEAFPTIL